MRFFLAFFLTLPFLYGQTCAPAGRLQPAGTATGAVTGNDCQLADGTRYVSYALVLPTRGQIQLDVQSDAFGATAILRDADGKQVGAGASVNASVEAGAYTVVVNTAAAEDAGAFTLSSNFTPEPNTMCRASASVGLNDAVSGRLGDSSCHMPDNTPYDAYRLDALGNGTVTVTLTSDQMTPYLILRDADGRALAIDRNAAGGNSASISYAIEGDQRYTVVASTASGAGTYGLTVAFEAGESEPCRPTSAFSTSGSDQGQIATTGCSAVANANGDHLYYNYYDLKVADAGWAELKLTSSAFPPMLYLLDQSGTAIAIDYLGSSQGVAVVRKELRPGNYTVLAWSLQANTGGSYSLNYTIQPGPPQVTSPTPLALGAQLNGNLSTTSSTRAAEGVADVYQIVTTGPGTLEIAMTSGTFYTLIALRDAKDNRLVANASGGQSATSYLAADLPAGTYTVVATGQDAGGSYSILTGFTAHALATCAVAQLGAGWLRQALGSSSCPGADGQQLQTYEMTNATDGVTALTLTSPPMFYFEGYLTLEDTSGNILRRDKDSWGQGNALIVQFLPAGTYRVTARAADGSTSGYYNIERFFTSGARPPACGVLDSIAPGQTASATLDITSCQYADDTFADTYRLDVADSGQFQFALEFASSGAWLLVLDAKGNLVDQNAGTSTSAQLSLGLDPGSYYVVAKTYSGYSADTYQLNVAPQS